MRRKKRKRKYRLSRTLSRLASELKGHWDLNGRVALKEILILVAKDAQISIKKGKGKEFMIEFRKEFG